MADIDALVAFFETITPGTVGTLGEHYAPDAYFKDPFNEVRGVGQIARVFAHMFEQVADPAFRVTERIVAENGAFLAWDFTFRLRPGGEPLTVHGSTHLRFDSAGKVAYHCDYWDAAGELYARMPVLGYFARLLRRKLAAPQ